MRNDVLTAPVQKFDSLDGRGIIVNADTKIKGGELIECGDDSEDTDREG